MQVCGVGTEEHRDNPTENEDSLAVSFVVGLTGVAKGFLDVLKLAMFPAKRQIY
jgi:hypothetical protein